MKKLLLLLFFIAPNYNYLFAQTNLNIDKEKETEYITSKDFQKLINRYFINFNTGQEISGPSSFAGLDIQKTDVTFTPTYVNKKKNIWTLKFNGGITEGISSVFKNNKFNTNINAELKYTIRITPKNKVMYSFYDSDDNAFQKALTTTRVENLEAIIKFLDDNKTKINDDVFIKGIKDDLTNKIAEAKTKITNSQYSGFDEELKTKFNETTDKIKQKLGANSDLSLSVVMFESENNNKYAKKYKEELKKLKLTGMHLKWISIAGNVRNDAFKLLDRSKPFETQVIDENYVGYGGSISYNNYYFRTNDNSKYFSLAATFENKSNYLLLDDVEVNNTTQIGTDTNISREVTEKYTAYEGKYIKYINEFTFNFDYYYFINSIDNLGFHFYEKTTYNEIIKPNYDLGLGLVFSFKSKDKESVVLNAEAYYTLVDIASNNSDINALERNSIGLRFTLPFNFNFNNN